MTRARSDRPPDAREVADRLEALGIRPSRRLGQTFLTDPFVADAEAALVGSSPSGTVVEIGGGLGLLTEALLRRGVGPLVVVERDPRLATELERRFEGRIRVEVADATTWPLPPMRAAVGNLPYSSASKILMRLIEARVPRVVAMVQREVAERLAASPGSRSYGRLSVLASLYGTVELQRLVGPESFEPQPKVESRILSFDARDGALPLRSTAQLDRVLRALFSGRRKQLGNLVGRLTDRPAELAAAAGWPDGWQRRRPEELPAELFFRLADALVG